MMSDTLGTPLNKTYRVSALLTRRYEMYVSAASETEAWHRANGFDYLWDTDLDVVDLKIEKIEEHQLRKNDSSR